jgi:PAS domain S-box-containing protein
MLSKFTPQSLRVRLMLVVLIAALPASLLVLRAGLKGRELAKRLAEERALGVARLAASQQEHLIEGARQLLTAMAQLPVIRNGTEEKRSALLAWMMKGLPDYANLGMVDMDGSNIASAVPKPGEINVADLKYYQRCLATQDFAVGDFQVGKITGRACLNVAYPVRDDAEKMTGMVFAALSLDWLNRVAAGAKLPPNSTVTIYDPEGKVLARQPDSAGWVGKTVPASIERSVIFSARDVTKVMAGIDGVVRLHAIVPMLETKAGIPAHVSVGFPIGDVYAEAARELTRNLLLLAVATSVALCLSWLVGSRLISQPIRLLVSAARRIAAGDFGARVELPAGRSAISQLGRAFDEMARFLDEQTAERARAKEELRESEERLRVALAAGGMGTFRTDMNRGVIFLDERLRELHGIDPSRSEIPFAEAIGKIHPDDRAAMRDAMERTLRLGESDPVEFRIILPDGSVRWLYGAGRTVGPQQPGQIIGVHFDITQRKEAEEQFRSVLRYSRTITMHSVVTAPEGWDRHGPEWSAGRFLWDTTVDDDATARGILPVKVEEGERYIDAWLRARIEGERLQTDLNAARAFVSGAASYSQEIQCVDETGRTRHFQETTAIQPAGHGRWKVVFFDTDITELKEAEEKLRQNEERLRMALHASDAGVWERNLKTGDAIWSMENYELYGMDPAKGRPTHEDWAQAVHPDDRVPARKAFRDAIQGRTSEYRYELRVNHPQRGLRWLLTIGRVRRDPDGTPASIAGINIDITGRKLREEAQSALAAIVESSDEAIIGKTADSVVTSWNRGAELLFGYSACEMIGKSITNLLPPDIAHEEAEIISRIRKGERIDHCESRRLTKDGRTINVSLTISPIRDARGQVVGASQIAHDITARKQAEEKLREAKEAAESASRAKGEFLANMSHEIRTPMNGLIGMLNLLVRDEPSEERRASLEIARTSAASLLKLLEEILALSKIESGNVVGSKITFSLDACMANNLNAFAAEAAAKGLALVSTVAPDVPDILVGDEIRLGQILTNLIGNAVKFTERGQVGVRVDVEEISDDALTLRFAVSDTGIGIPATHIRGIFDPFTQVDASSTRAYGGVGLGLAITRRLVETLGGNIRVESELGKGSTFFFTVRLRQGEKTVAG